MTQLIKIALTIITFLSLSGCGTAIELSKFTPVSIVKSPNAPSKKMLEKYEASKVIITDLDNNSIKLAVESSLGKSMSSALNSKLADSTSIQIVKRIDSVSLTQEIKAKELAMQTGVDVGEVDYIISGSISNVTYDYSFAPGYTLEIAGKKIPMPPKWNYKACVSGDIKIYSLPNLKVKKSIPFNECSSSSTDATTYRYPKIKDYGLVRQAGEEGIDSASYEVKNFFVKKGYIYEMRRDDDGNTILKTSLGKKDGAKEGLKVEIFTIKDIKNPLTEETVKEEVKIGDGVVTNQIGNSFSWIKIENLNSGESIMIGDFIKIQYQESILSKVIKMKSRF